VALLSATVALGQLTNRLLQNNPEYQDPNNPKLPNLYYYTPDQELKKFTIHHAIEDEPFEFEAVLVDSEDGNDPYRGPGDILSIIADPNSGPVVITIVHPGPFVTYGARDVGNIDLVADGVTGIIGQVLITGNLTDPDDPNTHVLATAISDPLTVNGDITQLVQVAWLAGNITCQSMGDLSVTGAAQGNPFSPSITIYDSYGSSMDIHQGIGTIDVGGDLSGQIETSQFVQHLKAGSIGSDGVVHVGTQLDHLEVTYSLLGTVTTGTTMYRADVGYLNEGGVIDVGTDLGGSQEGQALVISAGLAGTVRVGNDLLAQGDSYVEIGYFVSPGQLEVVRDEYGLIRTLGGPYDPALPAGTSISVGRDFYGAIEVDDAGGTITVGDQVGNALLHVFGDLTGTVHSNAGFKDVDVDGSIASGGQLTAAGELSGELDVTGDVDGAITAQTITADIDIDGSVDGAITAEESFGGSLSVGGRFAGHIGAGTDLSADIVITGQMTGDALVTTGGSLAGSLDVPQLSGTISVGGDLSATISASVAGTSARVSIGGNLTSTGTIQVPANEQGCCTTGTIEIAGDASGTIDVPQLSNPLGPSLAQGHIIVNGSFSAPGQITLAAPHWKDAEALTFVCIGYDGFDPNQPWDPNAVVIVNDPNDPNNVTVCEGNRPDLRIIGVTECRGDMNNDGAVGFPDLNPYLLAKDHPADYAVAFPGLGGTESPYCLGGSRIWHGDANCDGTFNNADNNPFVALVIAQCCDPECPGCSQQRGDMMYEGGEGLPGLPAEELAAELAANIGPELFNDLLSMVLTTIETAPDEESQAYWQAVYAALTQ
jgi:hypothetical protein